MTKKEMMDHIRALYRMGNRSDSDTKVENGEEWTHPDMAGNALCYRLDQSLHHMVEVGVITPDELQELHDTL